MTQQIIVDISEAGEVTVEAVGCRGTGCAALTQAIERAIGSTVGDVKKPEFNQQQQAVANAKQS
jgi:hypothetical protein